MKISEIWSDAQKIIRANIQNQIAYTTYILPIRPISLERGVIKVAVPSPIVLNMIKLRHVEQIEGAVSSVVGENVRLEMIVSDDIPIEAATEKSDNSSYLSNLNPRYTFENFVVGPSNAYAAALAQSVASDPGNRQNPLFLFGKSGLGKTHLMHAIGNEIIRQSPDKKVLYATCERFTIDMINSVRDKDTESFRKRYRDIDVLMIDDIQFIENKQGTQEEFFHTFNDLHLNNKQIVLTSDRMPKELKNIEERLVSRFEWGVTMDITTPDYETRMAILKKKAENLSINIPPDVLSRVAERVTSNVRELEGALMKIVSLAGISNKSINNELADVAIRSIIPEDGIIKITPSKILSVVCSYYEVSKEELIGKSKMKNIAKPRQIAMYLCKTMTNMNFVEISKEFGNRDRTTVMYGVDKIMAELKTDSDLKSDVDGLIAELNSL